MKPLLLFTLVASSVTVLDGQSLRERAKNEGGTIEITVFENQGVATLPYLVRNSELVIHAQIQVGQNGAHSRRDYGLHRIPARADPDEKEFCESRR